MTPRVLITPAASLLVKELKERYGELMFHQSGGCCDGSSPMCFSTGEFRLGGSDVCLGEVDGSGFWMSKDQFEYWKHTQLSLDVVKGRGAGFSLEAPTGNRFMIRSKMFTDEQLTDLEALKFAED